MEAFRRIGNVSQGLPWIETASHLSEYNNMLRISGYSEKERYNFTKGALERHCEMQREVQGGGRASLFRTREEIKVAKEGKGGLSSSTWFLGGDVAATIMCQASPGSRLARIIREKVGKSQGGELRVVMEEGGVPLTQGLKESNPFRTRGCQYGDSECLVDQRQDCGVMSAVYIIRCNTCQSDLPPEIKDNPRLPGGAKSHHYLGKTATSLHIRMLKHRSGHKRQAAGNALHRHDTDVHQGEVQTYTARVIQREKGLLHLTMREAILIEAQEPTLSMNDRMEAGRGNIIRLTAARNTDR